MRQELKNKEWREFELSSIFDIKSTGSSIDKSKLSNKTGNIPYITRTDKNNGIDCFIAEQEPKYKIDTVNVITIGLDTQTVFFQATKFYTGQNIQVLSNSQLNKYIAAFFIPLLKRLMEKFNWGGNGATLTRLKRSKMLLPINTIEEPDYEFMEAYMREKESELLKQYRIYAITLASTIAKIEPLSMKDWKEFFVKDLFVLVQGKSKGLNHLKTHNNGINYLGATNLNNGVLCQVENSEKLVQQGNCIAFIRNGEGSMGYSIYKAENCIATSDISLGYNSKLNRYNGLFITSIADRIRGKYNFGYKRSGTRLSKESLLLPVTNNGKPDFLYMEQYMKQLEADQLTKYLTYIENHK